MLASRLSIFSSSTRGEDEKVFGRAERALEDETRYENRSLCDGREYVWARLDKFQSEYQILNIYPFVSLALHYSIVTNPIGHE